MCSVPCLNIERRILLPFTALRDWLKCRPAIRRLAGKPAPALVARQPRGITRMTPAQRERAMHALARSPVPQIRSGYQAVKRLCTFLFYAVTPDGTSNPAWPTLGYALPVASRVTPAKLRVATPRVKRPTTRSEATYMALSKVALSPAI